MVLFIVENNVVKPTIEILIISPFKEIWDRDTTDKKEYALKEFAYIEFMCSPKKTNMFYGYPEVATRTTISRSEAIINSLFAKSDFPVIIKDEKEIYYEPDSLIQDAIKVYKEFFYNASPSLSYLESVTKAANKLKDFFDNFDMNELSRSGMPMHKPADIQKAIKESPEMLKAINTFTEKVHQELFDTVKTKGNRSINIFEE